jgi:sugar phosphate isomerase/epimerase
MSQAAPIKLLAGCWTSSGDASPLYDTQVSPVDLFDRISYVGQAGFKGIGFLDHDLRSIQEQRGTSVMRDIAKAVADAGLERIELEYLKGWYGSDPERLKAYRELSAEMFDWAGQLGAHHVKAGTNIAQPQAGAPDLAEITDAFGRLCERARAAGTRVAWELQPWNEVFTVAEALQVVQGAGNPAGGLLMDIWHVTRGGLADLSLLEGGKAGSWVMAVELDDADPTPVGTLKEDSINGRHFCGEGSFDLPWFIGTMKRAGFNDYWGVELLSHEIRRLPVEVALRRAYETTTRQIENVVI